MNFDEYCDRNDIIPGEEPAAFAAYLNSKTGWDGTMHRVTNNLSFSMLRETNVRRCEIWHPGFPDEEAWTIADWSNALCGEAGEAANVVKKIRRVETGNPGRHDPSLEALRSMLADELADIVIYADLLGAKAGIDLGEAVTRKFNFVSGREGFSERLP